MKCKHLMWTMTGLMLAQLPAHAAAISEQQQVFLEKCNAHASCRSEFRDDGIVFFLKRNGQTDKLLCTEDGTCFRLEPKGRRNKVSDLRIFDGD